MTSATVRLLLTIEIPNHKPVLIERWLTTKLGTALDGKPMIPWDASPGTASECELEVDVQLLDDLTYEAPHIRLQVGTTHVAQDGMPVSWSCDSKSLQKPEQLSQLEIWLAESESEN